MKKFILLVVALIATSATINAQDKDVKYRRSTLYTIKLDKQKAKADAYKEATAIMEATYDTLSLPNVYNNFNLNTRHIQFEKLADVTEEEIAQYGSQKKGVAGLKSFGKGLASSAASIATGSDVQIATGPSEEEYVAKLMKWFEADKTANKLVAKWHNKKGADPAKANWDTNLELLAELGMAGMSEEEKDEIITAGGSVMSAAKDNEPDVVPNTFVVVHRYSFVSGEEIFKEASAPLVSKLQLASNPLIAAGIQKGIDALQKKFTGYFVRCYAYLFQLEYSQEDYIGFYENYFGGKGEKGANYVNANYKLKYIGKSSGRAKARKADDGKVVRVAMARATDKCYRDLQNDNPDFRPMVPLHEEDGKLVAYIGTKEGVTEKSVFDVLAKEMTKEGRITFKKVGSLKVEKGCVWDNQAGAGDAAEDDGDDDEVKGDASLTYTTFKGKPGKIGNGNFIKLAK